MKEILQKHLGHRKAFNKELFDALLEKKFTVKDLTELDSKINYRTINHWDEQGYLFSDNKEAGWRKFSFAEYIWILFLDELREFGVAVKSIIPSLYIDLGIRGDDRDQMDQAEVEKLRQMSFQKLLKNIDRELVLRNFCSWLVTIVSYKMPMSIRFFKDGSSALIYGNPGYLKLTFSDSLAVYKQVLEESNFKSSISISIDSLIKDFVSNKDLDNISELKLFNEKEMEVLQQLRNNQLKEITIYLESGKPERIKIVEKINNADVAKRIKENFLSNYQSCKYVTNGGITFTLERETSIQL